MVCIQTLHIDSSRFIWVAIKLKYKCQVQLHENPFQMNWFLKKSCRELLKASRISEFDLSRLTEESENLKIQCLPFSNLIWWKSWCSICQSCSKWKFEVDYCCRPTVNNVEKLKKAVNFLNQYRPLASVAMEHFFQIY